MLHITGPLEQPVFSGEQGLDFWCVELQRSAHVQQLLMTAYQLLLSCSLTLSLGGTGCCPLVAPGCTLLLCLQALRWPCAPRRACWQLQRIHPPRRL